MSLWILYSFCDNSDNFQRSSCVLSGISHGTKYLCSGIPILLQFYVDFRYIYFRFYVYKQVSQKNSFCQFGNVPNRCLWIVWFIWCHRNTLNILTFSETVLWKVWLFRLGKHLQKNNWIHSAGFRTATDITFLHKGRAKQRIYLILVNKVTSPPKSAVYKFIMLLNYQKKIINNRTEKANSYSLFPWL